ncbi:MAG: hypothetical protein V1644_02840 [Candidatus Micrarchaeota archaeon]
MEVLKRKIAEIVGDKFVTMHKVPNGSRRTLREIHVKLPYYHTVNLVEFAARENELTATSQSAGRNSFICSIGIEGNELPTPTIAMYQNKRRAIFVIKEKGVEPIHHMQFAGFFRILRDNMN